MWMANEKKKWYQEESSLEQIQILLTPVGGTLSLIDLVFRGVVVFTILDQLWIGEAI